MERIAASDEAAAIAAAVARFEAETTLAVGDGEQAPSPWQQAALGEGVASKSTVHDPKGGARWLS